MGEPDDPIAAWSRDEDLARLERAWQAERRAEAAEYERLAALDLDRSRRLGDVALALCHRGDVVAVTLGGQTFTGTIVAAAADLACLRTASADVDLRLSAPLHLRVVRRVRAGGGARGRGAQSFRARLAEHEASGERVEVVSGLVGAALLARIRAASPDHVVLVDADGRESYLSIAAIDAIVRRRA